MSKQSGQSVIDRVKAAQFSISGQELAKSVHKATTEEITGPKKKHLEYLERCTNEPNVSIPDMANHLMERARKQNWVVVFKSLITMHSLINNGNERFLQYLASNNYSFNLTQFLDRTTPQAYDMSVFIRRYANYLIVKTSMYRQLGLDFCKAKRGKENGLLRRMDATKLLKTLPCIQQQLDSLLEFQANSNDLTNGVINAAFLLIFKDLIRMFACYNDGIINLLEKYFEMGKKQCREGLDIYKKFLVRMDTVSEFLKVAEHIGIDKEDIPDLARAPASLLTALEQHLAALEGKPIDNTASSSAAKHQPATAATLSTTNHSAAAPSAAVGTAISQFESESAWTSANVDSFGLDMSMSEEERQRVIEEEEKQLKKYKEQRETQLKSSVSGGGGSHLPSSASSGGAAVIGTLPSPPIYNSIQNKQPPPQSVSLAAPHSQKTRAAAGGSFGTSSQDPSSQPLAAGDDSASNLPPLTSGGGGGGSASDDLLQLQQQNTNPFQTIHSAQSPGFNPFAQPQVVTVGGGGGGFGGPSPLSSDSNFAHFPQRQDSYEGFGDILQPMNQNAPSAGGQNALSANDGDVGSSKKLIDSKDVVKSLHELTDNLDLKDNKRLGHKWEEKKPGQTQRTGGSHFQAPAMASTTWPAATATAGGGGIGAGGAQPIYGANPMMNPGLGGGMGQPVAPGVSPFNTMGAGAASAGGYHHQTAAASPYHASINSSLPLPPQAAMTANYGNMNMNNPYIGGSANNTYSAAAAHIQQQNDPFGAL